MSYYLAPSLTVLRSEIDARWPDRDRRSDGWIGDEHHVPPSDHLPNSRGSVNALDVDRDGIDMPVLLTAFEQHPSAQYWIFDRQIANRAYGWQRRPYTGSNPHTQHVHLSIRQDRAAEQTLTPWGLEQDMPLTTADAELVVDRLLARIVHSSGAGYPAEGASLKNLLLQAEAMRRFLPSQLADLADTIEARVDTPELDYDLLAKALLRQIAG